jgi:hypothetical protein
MQAGSEVSLLFQRNGKITQKVEALRVIKFQFLICLIQ